jgi:hypothetical protein
MSIELVYRASFENVTQGLRAALSECGFEISEQPMPAGNRVRMCMWTGEKGNKLLAMFLGFIFKVERVQAMVTAYQDGTTALAVHDAGASGSDMLGVGGGLVGAAAHVAVGQQALPEKLRLIETKLAEKLGPVVAYRGRPPEGALPLMA